MYDDQSDANHPYGQRARDSEVDLTGDKPGSLMAMKLIENVLTYFAKRVKVESRLTKFSIRGDEYLECLY
jgi:hypothetical protein